jgi:hypothetical protein
MKNPNVQEAYLSDKGDPEYGVLDKVLKEQQMSKKSYDREKHIGRKYWIWTNNRLKKLPHECRLKLIELAKYDVKLCIDNNGIHDPICQDMAVEVQEMEEYLRENKEMIESFSMRCTRLGYKAYDRGEK